MISDKKPLISEPKVLITGVEGAGKTLFAVQQADLLSQAEGGEIYQVNIRGADPHHLPRLPFDLKELAYNDDRSPMLDPETGEHLPKWATLPPGTVVIVDEAHKVFPQRGPGRPPRHIEMMAEGRQAGVRFVLLSQAPDSIDSFLRQRIHRHYHLERKGNLERSTVFEFDHCVSYPRTAWQERKDAQVHFWAFPKRYYGWWESAKTHSFKFRIPWKIWAALVFVPFAGFFAWKVIHTVGGLTDSMGEVVPSPASAVEGKPANRGAGRDDEGKGKGNRLPVTEDPSAYLKQFQPLVPTMPWSAVAFQRQEVQTRPELYCMAVGQDGSEGCRCYTEQATPYELRRDLCQHIARNGIYNPHRSSVEGSLTSDGERRGKPEAAREGPPGVRAETASPPVATIVIAPGGSVVSDVPLPAPAPHF